MRIVELPTPVLTDVEIDAAQQIAELLLDPQLNQTTIRMCLLLNPETRNFIDGFDYIHIRAKCPRPETRIAGRDLSFEEFTFCGQRKYDFLPQSDLPIISGELTDLDGEAWFHSSPHEFHIESTSAWTTNDGFYLASFIIEQDDSDAELTLTSRAITLPRKRSPRMARYVQRSISANRKF